jgi:hypothetical protein
MAVMSRAWSALIARRRSPDLSLHAMSTPARPLNARGVADPDAERAAVLRALGQANWVLGIDKPA